MFAMEEGKRLGGERAWSVMERLLIALTFGCFVLMALKVFTVSMAQLLEGEGGWLAKLLSFLLPGLVITAVTVLWREAKESGARRFVLVLFLAALALKGTFAALVDTQPISDFGALYFAAVKLAQNGTSLTDQLYFARWSYQSGPVVYMAALVRLFGTGLLSFKLANALWAALTSVMVYALAKRFASEGGARGAAVLYTMYPGTWLLVPVLTNQHLSELLFTVALYIYTIPAQDWKKRQGLAAAAGAVLALGNAVRPMAVVALAAAGCLMVLEMLRERRSGWKAVGNTLACFALFALTYAVVMQGLGGLVKLSGVNDGGLSNSCPEWKFVCGLNEDTKGGYSKEDDALVFGSEDPRQAARKLVLERVKIPLAQMLRLFESKIKAMWGSYEPTVWMLTPNVVKQIDASAFPGGTKRLRRWVQLLSSGFYALSFLLAAVGGAAALKGRGREREAAQLAALVALAYFGVHLLIEIQPRYRLLMYVMVFPLAALGLDALGALWDRRKAGGDAPKNT